jgi:phosphoribosylformylglycinamidine synthase II
MRLIAEGLPCDEDQLVTPIHEIRVYSAEADQLDLVVSRQANAMFNEPVSIISGKVYLVEGVTDDEAQILADQLFTDPVTQINTVGPRDNWDDPRVVHSSMLPGVMNPDNEFVIKGSKLLGIFPTAVDSSIEYTFGEDMPLGVVEQVTHGLLVNKTIQYVLRRLPESLVLKGVTPPIEDIPIRQLDKSELNDLSIELSLFLDDQEMYNIQDYFKRLGREPTDGELEYLGGAWSEHCCHKTFNAKIFRDGQERDPLFKRLKDASTPYFGDEVISAYSDNSGVFRFYDSQCIAIKLETHNSPSAIEPYGGSMTGVGGVLRDIMGTGQGAKNILSLDIFCFAPIDMLRSELPDNCLASAYLLQRCVDGVRDYGNRFGVPTSGGSIKYHEDFRAKPTVMVGALGIMPEEFARQGSPDYGDFVVTIGGKTGLDGIHGATFSSGEMTSDTAELHSGAVQIGNAIEEKRMADALLEARDEHLITAITDCGAGGLSSAVGEMGEGIGVQVDLVTAPLKYSGLAPWQIWMSESQERMVAAIHPDNYGRFAEICLKHGVESVSLGTFGTIGSPRLDVKYDGEKLIDLDYEFIKGGRSQREFIAEWKFPILEEITPLVTNWEETLQNIMKHGNVRSNEPIVRQYDHEVQGTNVMKPYAGLNMDAPNDAAVIVPILGKPYGLVEAHGMNPALNNIDPYRGAKWAFAEAMANYVSAGGNPDLAMLTDNFVTATPDTHVMGALDMMMDGLTDCLHAVRRPVISGKDSLSSRYKLKDGNNIDIPPVLTVTVAGKIPDIAKTVSTDIKRVGSSLVLVGNMDYESMGGSTFYDIEEASSARVPDIDLEILPRTLRTMHSAIQTDSILSCHDVSEGGIAAGVAEMCFGGDCGAGLVLPDGLNEANFLLNETAGCFIVEVEDLSSVERLFAGVPHTVIGKTLPQRVISLNSSTANDTSDKTIFSVSVETLKLAWKRPMKEFFS